MQIFYFYCIFIVFVWSRNGANWTKAFIKDTFLAPEIKIMWEQELVDPPIAYKTVVNVI